MSRTYRKKPYRWHCDETLVEWRRDDGSVVWEDVEHVRYSFDYVSWSGYTYYTVKYRADSPTGKKLLARGRRDKPEKCKEPGPSWWRNLTSQRPHRREVRDLLHKMVKGETDYEDYVVEPKPPLDYWT